jgi:hypothetical protein
LQTVDGFFKGMLMQLLENGQMRYLFREPGAEEGHVERVGIRVDGAE